MSALNYINANKQKIIKIESSLAGGQKIKNIMGIIVVNNVLHLFLNV